MLDSMKRPDWSVATQSMEPGILKTGQMKSPSAGLGGA
jgi:hypothetical protein